MLESYAFLLSGVIDLYEATLKPEHLDFAIALAETHDRAISTMRRTAASGKAPSGSKDLILRVKDDYDGAEPSGNSVATLALLKLAAITERKDFKDAAEKTIQLFCRSLAATAASRAVPAQRV